MDRERITSGPGGRVRRCLAFGSVVAIALASAACGSSGASPVAVSTPPASVKMTSTPWPTVTASSDATPSPSASATAAATPTPDATATPTPAHYASFYAAVVTRYDDTRDSISRTEVSSGIADGKILIPCEFSAVGMSVIDLVVPPATGCVPLAQMTARIHDKPASGAPASLGLLPPGLVSASVKVVRIGDADLFGSPTRRAIQYPLFAQSEAATGWETYSNGDVRTLISTGDTCPDRGQSYMAVTKKKGWDWVLDGGMARYRGFKTSQAPYSQLVPIIGRTGSSGQTAALISDNDVSANDFECPMLDGWVQHNTGMVFNIDPRVAPLLANKGGLKVVTLGSNHITDGGKTGVIQTVQILDSVGIKHTGAGRNIAEALAPAVVDVHGLKFAFVGWDDISGSRAATATNPGVAQMTDANVCGSIKAARAQADIVIAMPQWGWPEYHANITKTQRTQRQFFYDCGADGILGSGTHWASWVSIWPSADETRFAIGSHGNFLFDQSWSRQTMEGVIVEATYYGKRLVQFRLHPYVVVQGAQPCLLNPVTDGAYVLNQVWRVSDVQLTH